MSRVGPIAAAPITSFGTTSAALCRRAKVRNRRSAEAPDVPSELPLSADSGRSGSAPHLPRSQGAELRQFGQEYSCLLQIGGPEALGEPAVNRREEVTGFGVAALVAA